MKAARDCNDRKDWADPSERSIRDANVLPLRPECDSRRRYRSCKCRAARSSPGNSEIGLRGGDRTDQGAQRRQPAVRMQCGSRRESGSPDAREDTALSTRNPALPRATARRAVGTQFVVVTIRAVGFTGGISGPRSASASGECRGSEVDEFAALGERFTGGFQHAHHFQSGAAAIEGSFAFLDAVDEVLQFDAGAPRPARLAAPTYRPSDS